MSTIATELTDLQLMREYIRAEHRDPQMIKKLQQRRLLHFVNYCPSGDAGMAILYSRLAKAKQMTDDPNVAEISQMIGDLERLQRKLARMKVSEIDNLIEHLEEMNAIAHNISNYFKT